MQSYKIYLTYALVRKFGSIIEKYRLVGFDLSESRINSLKKCIDTCNDVVPERIKATLGRGTVLTTDKNELKECNLFIITVPTPIDSNNLPDFSYVISASEEVASVLKKGDIVTYESTVYPVVLQAANGTSCLSVRDS